MAGLISLAEKRRFRGADAPYAHWSHSALVVGTDGALVEAESTGVRRSPISRYKDDEYHLVRLGPEFEPAGRSEAVEYSNAHMGPVSYTHLRAHETGRNLVCRLLLE